MDEQTDQPEQGSTLVDLGHMTAAEAAEHISTVPATDLAALEAEESDGSNRSSVRAAIQRRRRELSTAGSEDDSAAYSVDDMRGYAAQKYGHGILAAGAFAAAGVATVAGLSAAQKLVDDYATREA